MAQATGAGRARVVLEPVPARAPTSSRVPLRARARAAWLYLTRDAELGPGDDSSAIAEPIGRLIDVAVERERVAERAAETEAARRAEVATTAILPRDLARPALAADRDHHRRLGARQRRSPRPSAPS